MIVKTTLRRVGASLVGVAGMVALATGCSSSKNGTPLNALSSNATTAAASTPATVDSGSGSAAAPSSSLPVSLPAVSSIPALGGSPFCKDLSGAGSLANLGSASGDLAKVLAAWDKLADEAPSEIKPDVRTIADYLHGVTSGKVDPAAAGKISTAAGHIGTWVATNCH